MWFTSFLPEMKVLVLIKDDIFLLVLAFAIALRLW